MAIDIGQGRGQVGEALARRGGNAGGEHDFLGERLGGLELGRGGAGAEDETSLRPQPIRQTPRQRRLGPDDGEVDALHVGRVGQPVQIVGGNRKVAGKIGGAGVAWRAIDLGLWVLAVECPAEGVLPPAAADHEQPHGFCAFRNASRARSAARLAASATWVASSRASPA